jgi:hypothetical protein
VLRPGGLLIGDDWYAAGNPKRENTGVSAAAEDFAREVRQPFFGQHRSFYVLKPL